MLPAADVSQSNHPASINDVATHLQELLRARFRSVQVQAHGEGLVLRGRVQTYYSKQVAQHLIMALTDLPIVANEIEVADASAATH